MPRSIGPPQSAAALALVLLMGPAVAVAAQGKPQADTVPPLVNVAVPSDSSRCCT